MLTFEDYVYVQPNLQEEKEKFSGLLKDFINADSSSKATKAMEAMNNFRNRLSTLSELIFIRASIDTNDDFYQKERDFFDELEPELQALSTEFYKALVKSSYREQLEEQWGSQIFSIADLEIQSFSPEAVQLLQKENKLSSEYAKLVASAEVEFQGETYTIAQLVPFSQDKDRSTRRKAVETSFGFYE